MDLKFIHKTKSPTFVELLADRGHPGPKFYRNYGNATNQVLFPLGNGWTNIQDYFNK